MKLSFLTTFILLLMQFSLYAQDQSATSDSVVVIENRQNLYRYQNFYLSGQPSMDALQWFKSQGVTRIVNIRSEAENEAFKEEAYDEETEAVRLGFDYNCVPVKGSSDYTPEKLKEMSLLLNDNEKVVIHCRSANRVTNFFMAYLVQTRGYTLNEAIEVGEELKFYFPLEDILGRKVKMELKDES
jgi:protein tyrosine phosphatase (PTP) superfamily phosphohydrolase (DUF442 family)